MIGLGMVYDIWNWGNHIAPAKYWNIQTMYDKYTKVKLGFPGYILKISTTQKKNSY